MLFFERKEKKNHGQALATKNIKGMNIDKVLKLAVLIMHFLPGSCVQFPARMSVSLCGPARCGAGSLCVRIRVLWTLPAHFPCAQHA